MTDLETRRLILRDWREADREPFARMNGDPRVMEYFPAPLSEAESNATMDRAMAHFERHGFGPWAVERTVEGKDSGLFIGFIGLMKPSLGNHLDSLVEIGWRLAFESWGQGLATEGAGEVLRYGFSKLGLKEIVAFTAVDNLRSRRVMEKLGMTRNAADDFDHPRLPEGHRLRRHVMYRKRC